MRTGRVRPKPVFRLMTTNGRARTWSCSTQAVRHYTEELGETVRFLKIHHLVTHQKKLVVFLLWTGSLSQKPASLCSEAQGLKAWATFTTTQCFVSYLNTLIIIKNKPPRRETWRQHLRSWEKKHPCWFYNLQAFKWCKMRLVFVF